MEIVHRSGKDHVNADSLSDPLVQYFTILMAVTFRTCHAVAASTGYGRMNSGIDFMMRWMT